VKRFLLKSTTMDTKVSPTSLHMQN